MGETEQLGTAESPSVAVVIINYNSADFVAELLDSLRDVDYQRWRLVVVDSGSTDGSAGAFERAFPSAKVVRSTENIGFAAGINVVLDQRLIANDRYVLFLNPDMMVTSGFLQAMVAAADERMIVVPKILYRGDPRLISTHAGGFDWSRGLFRDTFHGKRDGPATSVRRDGLETASFACALVPLRAFEEAGRMDERFFMYYEETDWLRRAQSRGYRIRYEPTAVVYHRESGSSGGGWMTPFKMYYATRNRPYLVRKHSPSRFSDTAFAAYFLGGRLIATVRLACRREWRLLRAMWLGARDYYSGRMGRTYEVADL
jgi:GT2 family glycosyltransferase